MLVSGPEAGDLAPCGPGKLFSLFEPQCPFLKNGHNSNITPVFIHSFHTYLSSTPWAMCRVAVTKQT